MVSPVAVGSRDFARHRSRGALLSDHAKQMIKTAIAHSKFEYKQIPVYSTVDPESLIYAMGFVDFFKSIGIVSSQPMITPGTLDNCGVMEGISDVSRPSDRAADFHFVLESANLNPRYTKWADATDQRSLTFLLDHRAAALHSNRG